jgi:hypothetical protein
VVWILTFYTLWLVRRESLKFVQLRHEFLISPTHAHLAQARTVLITSVPDDLADEKALRKWASFVPGGVGRVWVYKDSKARASIDIYRPCSYFHLQDLNKEYEERLKECQKLEKAVSQVLRSATKTWRGQQTSEAKKKAKVEDKEIKAKKKKDKQDKKNKKKGLKDVENQSDSDDDDEHRQRHPEDDWPKPESTMDGLLSLVPKEQWPKHRTSFLPFMGQKVDTIDSCKKTIATMNADIKTLQDKYHEGNAKNLGSAFLECNLQIGAHVLAQCVSYHEVPFQFATYMVGCLKGPFSP